jgi:hypothetical protein
MCRPLSWVLLLLSQRKVRAVIFIVLAYAFFLALVFVACLSFFPPSEGIKSFFAALKFCRHRHGREHGDRGPDHTAEISVALEQVKYTFDRIL